MAKQGGRQKQNHTRPAKAMIVKKGVGACAPYLAVAVVCERVLTEKTDGAVLHADPIHYAMAAGVTESQIVREVDPPWSKFVPQMTDQDVFDSLQRRIEENRKKDRWMPD